MPRELLTDRSWARVKALFADAAPLSPVDREARLAGAEPAVRREVLELLEAHDGAGDFLEGVDRDALDPIVGRTLGRWRVRSVLGRGGMGTVYLAERADGQYEQRAALKLVAPAAMGGDIAERFRVERQVLARLQHPNIARLLDGGLIADGRPYLVMEHVDGAPITRHCDAHGLSIEARLRLFRVVCEAVQHAHGELVVHRDLKPDNTLVTDAGEVKLLDFGIAKLLEPEAFGVEAHATVDLSTRLTPAYAAPEQLLGRPVSTATDVYSLGVLLYELLTGARPLALEGRAPLELARALEAAEVVPPSARLGRRLGDLDSIVLKALRTEPERRYVSAGQLGEEVGRFLAGQPVLARPDTLAYRARRFVGRNRAPVALAALAAAALGGFGLFAGVQARRAQVERDAARLERDKAERVVGVLVDLFQASNPWVRPDADKLTVRELLAGAEGRVLGQLREQPAVRARLRQVFGLIYQARDQYAEARVALEAALAEQEALLGPDHPDSIESLHALATLHRQLGDEAGALALQRDALERCRRTYGERHAKTARALGELATPARLGEARELLSRAVEIQREVLPPDHPDLADGLSKLAQAHHMAGDRPRALALYAEALAVFPGAEDRRHPVAITIMSDYAGVLDAAGEHARAEALRREALALARVVLGPHSFSVANQLNNLAVQLAEQGRMAEAEAILIDVLGRHHLLFGAAHPRTAGVARSLGALVGLEGRTAQALAWLDQARASGTRGAAGEAFALHLRARRAIVLHRLGREAEALAEAAGAVEGFAARDRLGERRLQGDSRKWQGLILLELGRPAEAEPTLRRAVELLRAAGETDVHIAAAEAFHAWALLDLGRVDEGLPQLRRALPIYRAWKLADRPALAALERRARGVD